jgi:hypothetical protein
MLIAQGVEQVGRRVSAAVVDQDDFVFLTGRFESESEPAPERSGVLLLIKQRNHDGNRGPTRVGSKPG